MGNRLNADKKASAVGILIIASFLSNTTHANPASDQAAFQQYFQDKFPTVSLKNFANGVYAIDPVSRAKWEEIEQFPPYDTALEEGKRLYNEPFKNGQNYVGCLPNGGLNIAQYYPLYDNEQNSVATLPLLINQCRKQNNEMPLAYNRGEMAALLAYLVHSSRGQKTNIVIQNDAAKAQYQKGKQFYYARRGQRHMACAHCHVDNAGKRLREKIISPALGQTNAFPVYRSTWGEMGTLHRRFANCNELVQSKPFEAQSEVYRNLEYFLSYMSQGIPITGPSSRQ